MITEEVYFWRIQLAGSWMITKQLEYVYCHYFVPESPPNERWAFDETAQWCAVRAKHQRPFDHR